MSLTLERRRLDAIRVVQAIPKHPVFVEGQTVRSTTEVRVPAYLRLMGRTCCEERLCGDPVGSARALLEEILK